MATLWLKRSVPALAVPAQRGGRGGDSAVLRVSGRRLGELTPALGFFSFN